MPEQTDLSTLISGISARRWFAIRRALDMPVEEITEDPIALMVVAANEAHRAATGKDDWARFLDSSLPDLTSALGLGGDDDDSKSDDAPES